MPLFSGRIRVVQLAAEQKSHHQLRDSGHQEQLEKVVLKQESAERKTQCHRQVEGPILPLVGLFPIFDRGAVHQYGIVRRRIEIEGNAADKITQYQPAICRKQAQKSEGDQKQRAPVQALEKIQDFLSLEIIGKIPADDACEEADDNICHDEHAGNLWIEDAGQIDDQKRDRAGIDQTVYERTDQSRADVLRECCCHKSPVF